MSKSDIETNLAKLSNVLRSIRYQYDASRVTAERVKLAGQKDDVLNRIAKLKRVQAS